jgi:cation transport ATPase
VSERDVDQVLYEQDDTDRKHGEHILAAVEASASAAQKPHPLAEAIARAYQAREDRQE